MKRNAQGLEVLGIARRNGHAMYESGRRDQGVTIGAWVGNQLSAGRLLRLAIECGTRGKVGIDCRMETKGELYKP